jgi:hypothetical protein
MAEKQIPVNLAGEYWEDPDNSSYKYEPDAAFVKPSADMVLIGHAYPSRPGAAESLVSRSFKAQLRTAQSGWDGVSRKEKYL